MAATRIADIIVPEVFNPYLREQVINQSRLVRAGIVVPDPAMNALAMQGGKLINIPFFKELDGDDEVLSDTTPLTPGSIGTGQDQARLHMRGRAWGVNDLAKALSGDDPMRAIGDFLVSYWDVREQALLVASLKGVFADNVANDASDLVHDVAIADGNNAADGNKIGSTAVLDACQKLGDVQDRLTAIAVHSVVYNRLLKLNLITFVPVSGQQAQIPTYLGKELLVDDAMPVVAGGTSGYIYTSFLFGRGSVARGEGQAPVPTETDRDSLQGDDILVNRRHFLLHPRGIAWQDDSVAGKSPTNTEAAAASNWDRVYNKKNIRIVALKTNG
jgi:hypothetical protein